MTPLSDILVWVASHSKRFARPGYIAPNHLANATVRLTDPSGAIREVKLDPAGLTAETLEDTTQRVEIYDTAGVLLFAEGT